MCFSKTIRADVYLAPKWRYTKTNHKDPVMDLKELIQNTCKIINRALVSLLRDIVKKIIIRGKKN